MRGFVVSWIRLEDGYSDHDKIVDFAATIGNPLAEAYLTRLWTWACRNRQSGDLSGMKPSTLAHIVRFPGDAQQLVDALHQCRLLDADWKIHNWHVYQGAIIEKREADRERSRAKWASRPKTKESRESRGTVARESQDSRETVAGLSRATVRDGTVRDGTQPNEEPSAAPTADAAVPAPEGKPVQEPLIPEPPKAPRKQREPSTPAEIDGERWRKRAYEVQNVPYEKAGAWPKGLFLAFRRAWDDRGIDVLMQSLDGLSRLPASDFNRKRGWTHWMAAECIDAGLAALNAPIASTGTQSPLAAFPIRYAEPAPLPGWTVETEIAACEAFSRGDRVRKFMVPRGEKLPEGFDVSTIPERFRPIRYQDEVQS